MKKLFLLTVLLMPAFSIQSTRSFRSNSSQKQVADKVEVKKKVKKTQKILPKAPSIGKNKKFFVKMAMCLFDHAITGFFVTITGKFYIKEWSHMLNSKMKKDLQNPYFFYVFYFFTVIVLITIHFFTYAFSLLPGLFIKNWDDNPKPNMPVKAPTKPTPTKP